MKNLSLFILLLFSCLFSSAQLVVDVYDGDTYKVLINGKLQVIRLANVDAPELNQYYGKLVKSRVSNLILGRIVDLELIGKDRFRRTVANVTVDGRSLDSILVVSGWAWHYVAYSHHPYLSDVESQARKELLGMWRCAKNVPPWIWRTLNKRQKRLHEMCR